MPKHTLWIATDTVCFIRHGRCTGRVRIKLNHYANHVQIQNAAKDWSAHRRLQYHRPAMAQLRVPSPTLLLARPLPDSSLTEDQFSPYTCSSPECSTYRPIIFSANCVCMGSRLPAGVKQRTGGSLQPRQKSAFIPQPWISNCLSILIRNFKCNSPDFMSGFVNVHKEHVSVERKEKINMMGKSTWAHTHNYCLTGVWEV
jgi:hypothetical protein